MQTIFRLEARWTGGPPPAAVAAALDALPRYDGDALMEAVRVLSPAAMHTGFLLHELRDRCELRRVRRDDRLWKLELRGPSDGQADVCCVLDFLDALGFRHVSVAGPDAAGTEQVLSATLWRQRFVDDAELELLADDSDEDDDDFDPEAFEFAFEGEDDELVDDDDGEEDAEDEEDARHDARLPAFGPPLPATELLPIRAPYAALAAVADGSVLDCLDTFARVADRLHALHLQHDSGIDLAGSGADTFVALAQAHGAVLDGPALRVPLYAHYAGLAAQSLATDRLGSLRLGVARAAQFTTVLSGLLEHADPGDAATDLSGLIGIARAASGFVDGAD